MSDCESISELGRWSDSGWSRRRSRSLPMKTIGGGEVDLRRPTARPASTDTDGLQPKRTKSGQTDRGKQDEDGRGRTLTRFGGVFNRINCPHTGPGIRGLPCSLPGKFTSGNQDSVRGSILVWVSAFQVFARSIWPGLVARIRSARPCVF